MTLGRNRWIGMAAAMLFAGVGSTWADYVILANGTRLDCTIIRRKLDGSLIVKLPAGQQEFTRADYKIAMADTPPEFTTGVQAFAAKNYQASIETMEKIASEKAGLEVDKQARYVIARAYIAMTPPKPAEAVAQFDALAKMYGEAVRKEPQVAVEYAGALLAAKQTDKLIPVLDELVQNAARSVAARAQTMRGQMREAQGQYDAALIDYMRTVVFFEKEADAVPEALFRAATVLEKKRDTRAKMLYKRIVDEYKDSPFAKEAAGKT